jgi:hypothetical protein
MKNWSLMAQTPAQKSSLGDLHLNESGPFSRRSWAMATLETIACRDEKEEQSETGSHAR